MGLWAARRILDLWLHPASLHAGDEPIVTAEGLYKVMRGWRDQAAG